MTCHGARDIYLSLMPKMTPLPQDHVSAIIEMALSDHISFAAIEAEYGLNEASVQALMRRELKPSSYKTWRKRVRTFSDRRESYK